MNEASIETRTVVIEREIPYPAEKLWRALTQPHLLAEWLMNNDFKLEQGHRFKFTADWGAVDCQVLAIEPNRKLTYQWDAMGLESVVTMTLTPTSTGTYAVTISATNSVGTATQAFTLTVRQLSSFTTAASATATVGQPFTFTVAATGYPTPTLSRTGTLPSGSSLTGSGNNYVYRQADGTAITFTDAGNGGWGSDSTFCTGDPGQGSCLLIPTEISRPDGTTVLLTWDVDAECWGEIDVDHLPCHYTPRLTKVSNSAGYEIRFSYASNTFGTSAWFQRTGAGFYNDAVSTSIAQASVSYSSPSTGVTQVTDIGGNVWRFTGSILGITGIRWPGAGSDTTTIAYSSGSIVSAVTLPVESVAKVAVEIEPSLAFSLCGVKVNTLPSRWVKANSVGAGPIFNVRPSRCLTMTASP